jgi:transcriptional regulator with XRE-family HTH domain
MEISERILLRLKSLDMKAVDVVKHPAAKRKGISKSNMTQWISGSGSPNLAKGAALAAALQTSVEWLVDGVEVKPTADFYSNHKVNESINSLELEIAAALMAAPKDVQDVVQALILRYQSDEQDGTEVAKAIKKLMGIS